MLPPILARRGGEFFFKDADKGLLGDIANHLRNVRDWFIRAKQEAFCIVHAHGIDVHFTFRGEALHKGSKTLVQTAIRRGEQLQKAMLSVDPAPRAKK